MSFSEWELQVYARNTGLIRTILMVVIALPFLILSLYHGNYGVFYSFLGYSLSNILYSVAGMDKDFSRSLREGHARIISCVMIMLFTAVIIFKC